MVTSMPAFVGHNELQQMNSQHLQIIALLGQIQDQLRQIQTEQQPLLVRLHNSTASSTAPLRYPVGMPLGPPLPPTRSTFFKMPGNQCQAVAELLGLPGLPVGATVAQRRMQIAEYVGVQS